MSMPRPQAALRRQLNAGRWVGCSCLCPRQATCSETPQGSHATSFSAFLLWGGGQAAASLALGLATSPSTRDLSVPDAADSPAQSLRTGPSTPPGMVSQPAVLGHSLASAKIPAPLLPTADAPVKKWRQGRVKSFEDRTGFKVSVRKPNLVRGRPQG